MRGNCAISKLGSPDGRTFPRTRIQSALQGACMHCICLFLLLLWGGGTFGLHVGSVIPGSPVQPNLLYSVALVMDNPRDLNYLKILIRRIRLGQIRLDQVRLGQIRLDQVRLGQIRLDQVRLGQIRLDQVRLGQIRLIQVN